MKFTSIPKFFQSEIWHLPKMTMHTWDALQLTRQQTRGTQGNPEKTAALTSKQSEFTSDLGSRRRLSIFSNRVSKLSPVDMMLLLVQYLRSGKQVQPTSSAGGLQPPGRRVGTSGSPGVPGSPSSPSLRGLRLSRPQAGGDSDPQPLRCPKSHPTRQPLATADSAVACLRVAPARLLSLAGPGSLRHGGAQSREGQRREDGAQQGGDSLGAAREGEEERRKRRAGEELRQLPPPPGPRAGPAPLEGAGGGLAPHPWFLSARPDALMSLGPRPDPHGPGSRSHF